jgi:N-acetyl-anhydromuramyl-L-alanine amidase AmpD
MLVLTHDGQVLDSSENVLAKLRSVQGVHQRRGWPDIAWHYIIDGEGNIYEGRNPDDRSNTGYDFDTNGMLVVGVLGDYDTQVPNQAQREAVVALMAWLAQEYSIGVDQIYAHSYFANQSPRTNPKITSPGRNFNVSEIQRQVEARLEGRN